MTGKRQKVKVLKIDQSGDGERGRSLMIIEDDSIKTPYRFATAIAPKNYPVKAGEYISKTEAINYVKPHLESINQAREMYEKLKKESK